MIPGQFEYHAPKTLDDALALLGAHQDAKLLAGGQSLIPVMRFRLAEPATLLRHTLDGEELAMNTRASAAYCRRHPRWKLSAQTHKILGMP